MEHGTEDDGRIWLWRIMMRTRIMYIMMFYDKVQDVKGKISSERKYPVQDIK